MIYTKPNKNQAFFSAISLYIGPRRNSINIALYLFQKGAPKSTPLSPEKGFNCIKELCLSFTRKEAQEVIDTINNYLF